MTRAVVVSGPITGPTARLMAGLMVGLMVGVIAVVLLAGCRDDAEPVAAVEPARTDEAAVKRMPAGSRATPVRDADPHGLAGISPKAAAARLETLAMADAIAKQGDARSLSVAALLRTAALGPPDDEIDPDTFFAAPQLDDTARDWLGRASAGAPDDVLPLVVALYFERADGARREALLARWRALEPDNLAPILFARLPQAALFEAATTTTVYDSHYDDVLRAIVAGLTLPSIESTLRLRAARDGVLPDEYVAGIANSFWYAMLSPSLQDVTTPCRQQPLPERRRGQCRWIAEILFRGSDTIPSERIGAGLLKRFAQRPSEREEADASDLEARWLDARISETYRRDPRTHLRQFVRLVTRSESFTERSLKRHLVVEAGFSALPPAGWTPDRER